MSSSDLLELPDQAISEVTAVFGGGSGTSSSPIEDNDTFQTACKLVAEAANIEIRRFPPLDPHASDIEYLERVADMTPFRFRRVELTGDWWHYDHGPLLAFQAHNHKASALVPRKGGKYRLIEPSRKGDNNSSPVTRDTASRIESFAYMFYRPLPDRIINWKDLFTFGLKGLGEDVRRLLFAMAAMSLLGLLVPVVTGMIFDHVIPNANIGLLTQFVLALAVSVMAIVLFNTTETLASIRLELKMNASLQAALWDRMLRLPISFFRRYSVGDLADRVSGIDEIQQTITDNVIETALGGVFSIFTLLLMIYYDWRMALGAVVLTMVFTGASIFTTLQQLKYQRQMYKKEGRLYGYLLQILNNITKLRISNRESAAFKRWLKQSTQITRLFLKAETVHIRLIVFSAIFSILATATLFVMVVTLGKDLSFGRFMAFSAAFGQFFASVLAMSEVIASTLEIVPLYERARPVLSTLPEDNDQGIAHDDLEGDIRINHLSFRYPQEAPVADERLSPWVFKELDLSIKAGEFVALVGPSGSGKSTLFRLLLGFESPTSGSIYYDGHDLRGLNIRTLRRQIGAVLQNSTLLSGTIMENIGSGSADFSEEQAWTAADYAGIAEDIEAMPMGMYTLVAEGGKNISAGQRQRILIARVLARKPKILFLDEATSALDNVTQARISRYIESLDVTCIVAAHRLSTIVNADRIYVLDKGAIVQQGTYRELAEKPGLFAQIAARQMI